MQNAATVNSIHTECCTAARLGGVVCGRHAAKCVCITAGAMSATVFACTVDPCDRVATQCAAQLVLNTIMLQSVEH
jgi:hypothetical protein